MLYKQHSHWEWGRERERGREKERKRTRGTSETEEGGRKGGKACFLHSPLTVSCPALRQQTRRAGPPHGTLVVIHTLFDVAPRKEHGIVTRV